jgi:hypothetical protein
MIAGEELGIENALRFRNGGASPMQQNRLGLILCLGLMAVGITAVAADDQPIPLDKVPAIVREAAGKAAPGIIWSKATKETEKGKTTYELTGKLADGREISAQVSEQGKLLEVETEINLADVPTVVTSALKTKMPKFKAEEAVTVSRDGKLVGYEFEGKIADGKEIIVFVSSDGKKVEIEDEE